jgi:hypothetical protein
MTSFLRSARLNCIFLNRCHTGLSVRFDGWIIISIYIKYQWAKNNRRDQLCRRKHSKVFRFSSRTSQGVHQGNRPNETGVYQGEDQTRIPRENFAERSQTKNREEGTSSTIFLIKQSQKVIAQQILKNNQMVNKYNNLDAQLQTVTFEYSLFNLDSSKCASVNRCKTSCQEWLR